MLQFTVQRVSLRPGDRWRSWSIMPNTSLASICQMFFGILSIVVCILNPIRLCWFSLTIKHAWLLDFMQNQDFLSKSKAAEKMSIIWFLWIQSCSQSCPRFRPRQSIYVVDRFYTTALHLNANNLLQSILCQMCLFLTGRIFPNLEIKQPRQNSKTALFQLCNCACQIKHCGRLIEILEIIKEWNVDDIKTSQIYLWSI